MPPSGSLHQGTLKGSTWMSVQGLTWQSLIVILGSTFDALLSPWQPHYGACAPTVTGPFLLLGGALAQMFSAQLIQE